MIKIQDVVRDIVMSELEAYLVLTSGYMNMSSYAYRIKERVEDKSKKQVTIPSLVVALSRLKKEFKKQKPLIIDIPIKNITTKMPLSEIIYPTSDEFFKRLETLHKTISISQKDFFTSTIGTTELDIICSSVLEEKVIRHFRLKPKVINRGLAGVGVSFGYEVFHMPNVFFSLLSVTARARINLEELVSTPTELIFIVAEKDFARTVAAFSELHKKTNK